MSKLILPLLLAVSLCGAPADNNSTVVVPSLKGIFFLASPGDFKKAGVSLEGVSVSALPLLDQAIFKQSFTAYIGQPLTLKGLKRNYRKGFGLLQAGQPSHSGRGGTPNRMFQQERFRFL